MSDATSTIAVTAYNMLAIAGRALTWPELKARIVPHHPDVKLDQLEAALAGMVERKFVVTSGLHIDLTDRQHRMMRARARTADGWDGWLIKDRRRGLVAIEDVIAGKA